MSGYVRRGANRGRKAYYFIQKTKNQYLLSVYVVFCQLVPIVNTARLVLFTGWLSVWGVFHAGISIAHSLPNF